MFENLTNPGQVGLGALQAFQQGRDMKRQDNTRSAFAAYATDPSEQNLTGLAQYDPQFVMQAKQQQAQAARQQQMDQERQMQQGREKMGMVARLLGGVTDEGTYQQARAAAQQMGLDVSQAPPTYNPNWVGQQRMIAGLFEKGNEQELSGMARELINAGGRPGTPEFERDMRTAFNNKYGGEYIDENGNTRRAPATSSSGPAPAVQEGATATNPSTGEKVQFQGGKWVPMGGQGAPATPFVQAFGE